MSKPDNKKETSLAHLTSKNPEFANETTEPVAPSDTFRGRDASKGDSRENFSGQVIRAKDDAPPPKKQ
jgi:hypothetical protein